MEELLQRLQQQHGLSMDQAKNVISTITSYIKEKFPMVAGAVDNLFPSQENAGNSQSQNNSADDSILDKISGAIPGNVGEKLENIAKDGLGRIFGEK